jgi:hypothetical protein
MATETAMGKPGANMIETPKTVTEAKALSPEYLAEHEALMARVLAEGAKRIRRSCERAMAMGIIDKDGNLLKEELPPDMLPGADRDFGG